MKKIVYTFAICTALYSCKSNSSEKDNAKPITPAKTYDFTSPSGKDSTAVQDGESILRYKNGVIKMRGFMKAGKRDGPWQSWYENGLQWSESIYDNGIKNEKTTTWYENGQKRYEGFYTNDKPSGVWIYFNEAGKKVNTQDYGKK